MQSGLGKQAQSAEGAEEASFGLRVAQVRAVNWQDNTVDLQGMNGMYMQHVPLATPWGGSNYGERFLPLAPDGTRRETWAIVAFLNGLAMGPVVLAFFYPEVSEMMHAGLQRLTRYGGDSFQAVSLDGDIYLAFAPDGSYISFHDGAPVPPPMYGTDYDQLSDPQGGARSLTVVLKSGARLHLDGGTGTVSLAASSDMRLDALGQMDLLAKTVTVTGLPALYPGQDTGLTSAPATADPAVHVAHLTTNAAWDFVGPLAERPDPADYRGWTYLTSGPAARIEIGPSAPRYFVAPAGKRGATIAWTEVPVGGPSPYKVPPPEPQYLSFDFQATGHLSWVCGAAITFTGARVDGVGTIACTVNGTAVATPSSVAPLALAPGDVLRLDATGVTVGGDLLVTLVARPVALPDYTTEWYTVHTDVQPVTVTAPTP